MADKDIGGGGREDEELVEEVVRTRVGEKLTIVAGRRTSEVGDMVRLGTMWNIKPSGKDAYTYNDKFTATVVRKASAPPAATRQISEREMLIDADARRQAQLAQWRREQAARNARAEAVEAAVRAKRVNTAKARAHAREMEAKAEEAEAKAKAKSY
jgi:hypothetical protein